MPGGQIDFRSPFPSVPAGVLVYDCLQGPAQADQADRAGHDAARRPERRRARSPPAHAYHARAGGSTPLKKP